MMECQPRDSHQSPTKVYVKRDRSSLKKSFDNLQTSHECRGCRVKNLMAEKRGLLARINDEKKGSKRYTDAILLDDEKVYSYDFVLKEEATENKRQVHGSLGVGIYVKVGLQLKLASYIKGSLIGYLCITICAAPHRHSSSLHVTPF